MAFPLFAFMIVEGCHKTKNIKKYAGRLALFALISEPFFYFGNWYRISASFTELLRRIAHLQIGNVFFTLAISVFAIWCYQVLKAKYPKKSKLLFVTIVAVASIVAVMVDSDYNAFGVILIMALYAAQTKKSKIAVILLWSFCLYGIRTLVGTPLDWPQIQQALYLTMGAALSCVPIWFYNGERGKKAKWVFYMYYPAHLLVFTLIGMMLFR